MAMKYLTDDKGEYILLAVGVSGQGYGNEWLSNFTVDDSMVHTGFLDAAGKVYYRISDYIQANVPEGSRIKLWISGFSRAAAVSNLTAMLATQSGGIMTFDSVFAYTFGTPNVGLIEDIDSTYELNPDTMSIFNICGSFDPVPKVPLGNWGYGKFGTTYYLPSSENCSRYYELAIAAADVYEKLNSNFFGFFTDGNRNWFIRTLLELMYEYMPQASDYATGIQQGVIAAWETGGSLSERLQALSDVVSKYYSDQEINDTLTKVMTEVINLVIRGSYDAIGELTGVNDTTGWVNLLSSGTGIAHDHYPEVYMAWMFSTDENILFDYNPTYTELFFTNLTFQEQSIEDVSLGEYDALTYYSRSDLGNEITLGLPAGATYRFTLKPVFVADEEECQAQVGYTICAPQDFSNTNSVTEAITLKEGDTIVVEVPAGYVSGTGEISILLNGETPLSTPLTDDSETQSVQQSGRSSSNFASMLVMIPYLIGGILLIIYSLVVLVRRIRRHGPLVENDLVPYRKVGAVLLVICAVASVAAAVQNVVQIVTYHTDFEQTYLTNQTIAKVSTYLGWGMQAYTAFNLMMHLMLANLAVRSIRHRVSRRRFTNLLVLLVLLNTVELFTAAFCGTLTGSDLLIQLIPILSLISIAVARIETPEEKFSRKQWYPIVWAIVFTVLLFLVRQASVFVASEVVTFSRVVKVLSSIPFVLVALLLWHRGRTEQHRMVFFAALAAFLGDALIDSAMAFGAVFQALSHCLLMYAFIRVQKPTKKQWTAWPIVFMVLLVVLQLMAGSLPSYLVWLARAYAVVLAALLVCAWPVSPRLRAATMVLAASDILLVIKLAFPNNMIIDVMSLMAYYIAMLQIIIDPEAVTTVRLRKTSKAQ